MSMNSHNVSNMSDSTGDIKKLRHLQAFGDDEVFFGSVPIALAVVPGTCEVYDHTSATLAVAPEEIAVSLARANKLKLGNGVQNAVVPCMPCVDIRTTTTSSTSSSSSSGSRQKVPASVESESDTPEKKLNSAKTSTLSWPKLLQHPLIKVPVGHKYALQEKDGIDKAVASGCRSGLVKLGHQWFRLKGCGNNDEGFILKSDAALNIVQIRGSAFIHTANRENYMTTRLSAELKGEAVAANQAMGMFCYGPPNQPFGNELAKGGVNVAPSCIVQQTLGDRRLGSHLLAGLTILLPQCTEPQEVDVLKRLFPKLRPIDPMNNLPVTTAELMTDHALAVMYEAGLGLSFPMPRNAKIFADVQNLHITERTPPLTQESEVNPKVATEVVKSLNQVSHLGAGKEIILEQITNKGIEKASKQWCEVWNSVIKSLRIDLNTYKKQDESSQSVLVYLYNRLGYDCGVFLEGLHKRSKVSWGTYTDAMCHEGQLHCNAHANNMVILAPMSMNFDVNTGDAVRPRKECFLSFLDLDMAFGCEDYLDTWVTGKVGINEEAFSSLLSQECANLMEVLVGADANLGVPPVAQEFVRSFDDSTKLLQTVLYDAMMHGFQRGYKKDEECFLAEYDEIKHRIAYQYIRLAIIKMANFVA